MPEDENIEHAIADYEERQRQEKNSAKAALLALVDQLHVLGVSQVCATFNGYGDEGSIEDIEFLDTTGQPITLTDRFPKLEETFYVLLPDGFEDNEGSSGTVIFDVEKGRIGVDVDWNVTTTENEHYEV